MSIEDFMKYFFAGHVMPKAEHGVPLSWDDFTTRVIAFHEATSTTKVFRKNSESSAEGESIMPVTDMYFASVMNPATGEKEIVILIS